jgi:hypothetical protein
MISFTIPEQTFGRDYPSLLRRLDSIRALLQAEYDHRVKDEEERKAFIKETRDEIVKDKKKIKMKGESVQSHQTQSHIEVMK